MAVIVAADVEVEDVDTPMVVMERLEAFGNSVLAGAMNRPAQMVSGGCICAGCLSRVLVSRCGRWRSGWVGRLTTRRMQHFLADSPWDPAVVERAVAERVAPEIDVQAWVLDDTGFVKDGKYSPGVKRQYSGTLGKIGNCQIAVSLHAVGEHRDGAAWAGRCICRRIGVEDPERRREGEDPRRGRVSDQARAGRVVWSSGRRLGGPPAPVLGDEAYGKNTELRDAS